MIPQKTSIDWFRFRTQANPLEVFEALKPLFPDHARFFNLKHQPRGLLGFQQASLICASDFVIGRMDYGGESQRGGSGWTFRVRGVSGCSQMRLAQ